jgi:imidazolonepropionase-like amidohydrolase/Tol biopolymer transport system component
MAVHPSLAALLAILLGTVLVTSCTKHPRGTDDPEPHGSAAPPWRLPPVAKDETKKAEGDDDGAWDVQAPPGPKQTVKLDLDEGTWMNLDVSPDGQTIVFDLLGDLYAIPASGGTARSLTSGIAWDMQPRFSPDGKWIAFTSDRGGGDNLWVVPATPNEEAEPRQISKEDFRLVGSPQWSPDGQFIAVRKHFTARRSLGSGEIWLYHISGSDGLQMTEKPNDQKDVGEPAFSPDGRWLYFSQDVTPGEYFEYNKDPHAGIYAIKRLDRADGRIETFIARAGGAVRPTPSPDGRWLAYVGREGLRTTLFVHDLESGAERRLYDQLDRDMQETWAIHGVYPTMAWTPDAKAIVFWAGGKIHRIELESGKTTPIPFRVVDERAVTPALRHPVQVHPQSFHTKMLRWAQVAPDGRSVVFQALGHLWVRDLPEGTPRRLTRDDDVFEHHPSFSRDGRFVVYTAWNDETLGSVRVVPRGGGRARVLTDRPGHYESPVFSPNGKHVVYRATGGGSLTSARYSRDPGLYVVDVDGRRRGGARLVTRSGASPHFGADDDRVFYTDAERSKGESHPVLKSIELDGSDERLHVRGDQATDFRVSPDGRWLAFREQFNAFVAPLPATGRAFKVGPKEKGLPIRRVSHDAGEYLHWSGDGRRLYWTLGPELFSRELDEAFEHIEGGPETSPPTPPRGLDIGFDVPSHRPKGTMALVGARIVTMRGDEVIEDGAIVIERDRIAAVGPRGSVEIPSGAHTVDVSGKTIVPGLIDVHAHGPQGSRGVIPQQNWLHYAMLTFGVTTVHDPSNDTAEVFAAAELARSGEIVAPRIFSTGTILYGAKAPFKAVIDSLDDARSHLRRMKAVGAFSVKSYNQPRRDQRQQVLAAARELEMMVVPEGGSLFQHNMTMVVDGHTGIEHAIPIERGYADVMQLWSGTEVGYTPTIGVGYGGLWGENYWYATTDVFDHPKLRRFVPRERYESRARRRVTASQGDWNHVAVASLAKQLVDAGVEVQLGAHGQREGLAAHWELWMFVQGGMTPHQALRAGTLAGAKYLGLDGDLGSLEPGKLADLAVIEGNPLDDIRVSDQVRFTMLGGRLFDADTMHEVAGEKRRRRPFFWEIDLVSSDPDAR